MLGFAMQQYEKITIVFGLYVLLEEMKIIRDVIIVIEFHRWNHEGRKS